jgi:hypothetical protein
VVACRCFLFVGLRLGSQSWVANLRVAANTRSSSSRAPTVGVSATSAPRYVIVRTARIIGHEARCAGRCVILCGRFGWDFPMQRLFLSRNIESATARVRRGRPAWLLLLHSPDSSDAARWRGAWCDQDPRWKEAEASEVHTLREEVILFVGLLLGFTYATPVLVQQY